MSLGKGRPVQHSVTALVELPTAIPAAKPLVAPSRDLTTLRNRRRATADTIHLEIRTAPAASSPTKFAAEVKPPPGARPDRIRGSTGALRTARASRRPLRSFAFQSPWGKSTLFRLLRRPGPHGDQVLSILPCHVSSSGGVGKLLVLSGSETANTDAPNRCPTLAANDGAPRQTR